MAIEYLSFLINKAINTKTWKPFDLINQNFNLSHLFFADDVLLFAKADEKTIHTIKTIITDFCNTSGMEINLDKSKLWLSTSISLNKKNSIANLFQLPYTSSLGTYLGYQLKTNKLLLLDFNNVVLKLQQTKMVSSASLLCRECQLVLTTLNQIPNYYTKVFSLPQKIHAKIDQINRNFLWGHSTTDRKIHLISWDTITKPKKLGGLSLRRSSNINAAFIAELKLNLASANPTV